jgi:hypothetical protein
MGKQTDRIENELKLAGFFDDEDDINYWIARDVVDIVNLMATQGHSGSTIFHVLDLTRKMLQGSVLSPLTGADDEWEDVSQYSSQPVDDDAIMFQNARCPTVFKRNNGRCFDVNAVIFVDVEGFTYTNSRKSCKDVTFPYWPNPEYRRDYNWFTFPYYKYIQPVVDRLRRGKRKCQQTEIEQANSPVISSQSEEN